MYFLLDDSLFPGGNSHGGYIPFVEVPCERELGESIKWIVVLSLGPVTCKYIPWVCCPLDLGDDTKSISGDLDCGDIGAKYGATLFWTMQATMIVGLVLSLASLAGCTAELAGVDVPNTKEIWIPVDVPMDLVNRLDAEPPLKDVTPFRYIKQAALYLLADAYRIGVKKDLEREGEGEVRLEDIAVDQNITSRTRHKRQVLDFEIPILRTFVAGPDDPIIDGCERDEVLVDGDCSDLLSQGPCEDDEYVVMDPTTRRGKCVPRLCGPDRVFVFGTQECHDPREPGLCPPGRQLYTSSLGTPVCGCPDGTYEEEDDIDDDVCEPMLNNISDCPPGEVFFFSSFRLPPKCVPDPCSGVNVKRNTKELPYVPSFLDGKCYQIGSTPPICKSDELYSLSLELLRGVCVSLEDAGYQVLDSDVLDYLRRTYGSFLPRDTGRFVAPSRNEISRGTATKDKDNDVPDRDFDLDTKSSKKSSKSHRRKVTPASTSLFPRPQIGKAVMKADDDEMPPPLMVGQAVVGAPLDTTSKNMIMLQPTHMSAFSPPFITVDGSVSFLGFISSLGDLHHRGKRSPLPHATPGNVFEAGLSTCRSGARRGANASCRETVLPAQYPPKSRPSRSVPPTSPFPSCPPGSFRAPPSRQCSSSPSSPASSINAISIG